MRAAVSRECETQGEEPSAAEAAGGDQGKIPRPSAPLGDDVVPELEREGFDQSGALSYRCSAIA